MIMHYIVYIAYNKAGYAVADLVDGVARDVEVNCPFADRPGRKERWQRPLVITSIRNQEGRMTIICACTR